MPIHLHKKINEHCELSIWHITENEDELTQLSAKKGYPLSVPDKINHSRRKCEWLSVRIMLMDLLHGKYPPEIGYTEHGKPILKKAPFHISVSHSGYYSAIIKHTHKAVGIDIEAYFDKIERVKNKFLSEDEKLISLKNEQQYLPVIWGAKETVYKIEGRKGVIFKEDILCDAFDYEEKGKLKVKHIKQNDICYYCLFYEHLQDFMLIYGMESGI